MSRNCHTINRSVVMLIWSNCCKEINLKLTSTYVDSFYYKVNAPTVNNLYNTMKLSYYVR